MITVSDDTPDGSDEMPRRLREARERSGLSLRQLAKRLDISASALSQIETGKSRPSVRTLYAVVSELGISLDELFDNHRTPTDAHALSPDNATVVTRGAAPDWLSSPTMVSPLVRAGDRPRLDLDSGVQWERLTAEHDPVIDFLHVNYEPGGASNANGALVRRGGRLMLIGLQSAPRELDLHDLVLREVDILTSVAHVCGSDLPAAIDLLADGRLAAAALDRVIPLEALVEEGLEPLAAGAVAGKVLVDPAA
jgi:transcriptional regulator with XRE-family HTH domain